MRFRKRNEGSEVANRRSRASAKGGAAEPPRLTVCGVRIDAHALDSATEWVLRAAREHRPAGVHLCNAFTLSLARREPSFQALLNRSEANFADGMPLVWLIRRLGLGDMRRRVYGPDLMAAVLDQGRETGVAHYLYGSSPTVLQKLCVEVENRYPGIIIAGAESPPFRWPSPAEQDRAVESIRSSGADVVWVGLGTPKQDRFVEDFKARIGLPLVAVGAAFDFHAGTLSQAPAPLQNAGLEWAYRLVKEPRRLWRRYLVGNASFVRGAVTEGTLVEEDIDLDEPPPVARIMALATSHNRRAMTLRYLESLREQEGDLDLHVVMVDDGCTDGTGEEVRSRFPDAEVIAGDGSLFWAGGMRLAFSRAVEQNPDFMLWANDDVVLDADAVRRLLVTHHSLLALGWGESLVVGAMADPVTGNTTYSGTRRGIHRTRFQSIPPSPARARRAETFNGNLALIPRAVYEAVGNIDPAFQHAMGDFDYGLRTRMAGFEVWVAPGHVGRCSQDELSVPWRDRNLSPRERFRVLASRKVLPATDWYVFTRRHGGIFWPLYWAAPYLNTISAGALGGRRRRFHD